jgi:serine/threonine protein kinase
MAEALDEVQLLITESAMLPEIHARRWNALSESLPVTDSDRHTVPRNLRPFWKKDQTGIYEVIERPPHENRPTRVIVYRGYCHSRRHPLNTSVIDYWFLLHLKETGLVPEVFALSGPLRADYLATLRGDPPGHLDQAKLNRVGGKINWMPCSHSVPEVRYILMERVPGKSIADMVQVDGVMVQQPLVTALKYTIAMLEFIENIHNHNVVHGDAHFGNFIVDPSTGQVLKMIDFERAAIYNESEIIRIEQPCVYGDFSRQFYRGLWMSPWESRGCAKSFRDDIHRIMITCAVMMFGKHYVQYQNMLVRGTVVAFEKTDPNWINCLLPTFSLTFGVCNEEVFLKSTPGFFIRIYLRTILDSSIMAMRSNFESSRLKLPKNSLKSKSISPGWQCAIDLIMN